MFVAGLLVGPWCRRGHQRPPADRGDAVQSPGPAASSGLMIPFTGWAAILVRLTSIFVCDELAQHICDQSRAKKCSLIILLCVSEKKKKKKRNKNLFLKL